MNPLGEAFDELGRECAKVKRDVCARLERLLLAATAAVRRARA